MLNKFPWTNFHGFNLDWVIKKVQDCVEAVESFGETIANIGATYETKDNITTQRKLSSSGNFTGTWNGEKQSKIRGDIDNNRSQISFLASQFADGATGLVIDGGFFDESGIKKNYNGGYF